MRLFNYLASSSLLLSSYSLAFPVPSDDEAPKDKRSFVERDGTNFTVFEHAATGAKMEFVTNSGICETTPGVNQYSGYLSVGTNMNMYWLPYGVAFLLLTIEGGSGSSRLEVIQLQHHLPLGSMEALAAAV